MLNLDASSPVRLQGPLNTSNCEETHRTIRDALEQRQSLILDCADAIEIDVSFLQILVAAQLSASRASKSISLAAPPGGALADALRRCGFAPVAGATSLARILTVDGRAQT